MRSFVRHFVLLALALPACIAAVAQPASVRTDGAATDQTSRDQSAAEAPDAAFQSTLTGYRRFDEVPPASWVQANDLVKAVGGWRSYAREAQEPQPARMETAPAPDHEEHRR